MADNIRKRMATRPQARHDHVTLTLATTSDKPLSDQLHRLNKAWGKLRESPQWQAHYAGGVAVVEVARTKQGRWHPHMHVVAERVGHADAIDREALSARWHRLTRDSHQVDVSPIKDDATAAYVVARYVSKPPPAGVYRDDAALDELIGALDGRHTAATFGTWRGTPLADHDRDPIDAGWQLLGPLAAVLARGLIDRDLAHVRRQLEQRRAVLTKPPPRPCDPF